MYVFTLPADATTPEVEQNLAYTTRRAGAHDETAAIHAEAKEMLTALRGATLAERDAEEARLAASALLGVRVAELYDSVSQLSHGALALVSRDRGDPRFHAAFPAPVSEALKGTIDDKKLQYCSIATKMIAAEPSFSRLAEDVADVRARLVVVEAERAALRALTEAETNAENHLRLTRRQAAALFNTFHPKLRLLFPSRVGLIRSFFLERRAKRPKKGGEPAAASALSAAESPATSDPARVAALAETLDL